ncbi:MAG TPA: hypothetical protein PLS95_12320 [Thermoanaerobaculales bacterium]|nr:hypothetical protein [Thermoanaerobaculales bacterium]
MGATYSPRPELVFPDPFDTIRAAMPGAKLAAEADAIILALQQILAAIREWKARNFGRGVEDPNDSSSSGVDIAYNIMQLAQILNGNIWGESPGLEKYLREKLGRAPTKAEMAKALADVQKAQIASWKKQLKALQAIRNPTPQQLAMIAYLKAKLKLGGR